MKLEVSAEILILISWVVFFIIHLSYTQKIYHHNLLTQLLFFSIFYPAIVLLFNLHKTKEDLIKITVCHSIFIIYFLLLKFLKKFYKKINSYFILKKWVSAEYSNKDFTFVHWDNDGVVPDYWDEKRSTRPSWLDKTITFLLLILPIILPALLYQMISIF